MILAVAQDCIDLNIGSLRTTVDSHYDALVTTGEQDHRSLREAQLKAARMIIEAIELERVVLDQVLRDTPADDMPF